MNFAIEFVEVGINMSYANGLIDSLQKLETNKVNTISSPKKLYTEGMDILEIDTKYDCLKLIAIVPVEFTFKIESVIQALIDLLLLPIIITAIFIVVGISGIYQERKMILMVVQLMFGVTVEKPPKFIEGRILFVSVIFVHLQRLF